MTQPNIPQVKVNVGDLDDIKCDKCGDLRFEPVYLLKRLPALVSPTGKDEIIPIGPPVTGPVFACYNCGHINFNLLPRELRPKSEQGKEPEKNTTGVVSSTLPELSPIVKP